MQRFRQRKAQEGGRRLDLVLDREAVDALLVCVGAHSGMTVSEIVAQLLRQEAERLKAK